MVAVPDLPLQRIVSVVTRGWSGGQWIPAMSSGVLKRRPVLSMCSAQNGSVPAATQVPVLAVGGASAAELRVGVLPVREIPTESGREESRP